MMRQASHQFSSSTRGQGLYNLTEPIRIWAGGQEIRTGLLTVYLPHTSASLTIQENADPDVLRDLNDFFKRLVPEGDPLYRHTCEGPDDMPAHIRSALTQTHLSVPVSGQGLELGTWQGIYLFEHRVHPQHRRILLHLIGE